MVQHVGRKKAIIAFVGVAIGDQNFNLKANQHMFNGKLYVQRWMDSILQQVVENVVLRKKTQVVQFAFIVYFFPQVTPMFKQKKMKCLFAFFKKSNDCVGWEIFKVSTSYCVDKHKGCCFGF